MDPGEVVLIPRVILFLVVGRVAGEFLRRAGQPAVVGALLAGLILGPSLFGWLAPGWFHIVFPDDAASKNLITGIADIGVMMLLLLTGMEVDLRLVRQVGRPAIAVAFSGVLIPFLCGFILGEVVPDSTVMHAWRGNLVILAN